MWPSSANANLVIYNSSKIELFTHYWIYHTTEEIL